MVFSVCSKGMALRWTSTRGRDRADSNLIDSHGHPRRASLARNQSRRVSCTLFKEANRKAGTRRLGEDDLPLEWYRLRVVHPVVHERDYDAQVGPFWGQERLV